MRRDVPHPEADASVFASLAFREPDAARIRRRLTAFDTVVTSVFTEAELASALRREGVDLPESPLRGAQLIGAPDPLSQEIQEVLDETAGTRDSPVFERSRKTSKLGDGYVQRFGQLVDSAVRGGNFAEAQQLQLLRMRLIRDYSGLWLLVNRPSS